MVAAFVALILGILFISQSKSVPKRQSLTQQQVEGKQRILKLCGYILVLGGIVLLGVRLFLK